MAVQAIPVALAMTQVFCVVFAVDLKVGLYNDIPDLDNDNLASYKSMVEEGFEASNSDHTVNAVVDEDDYSPYGNMTEYLTAENFDLIEIDTATLKQLIKDGLVLPISSGELPNLPPDTLSAAIDAVTVNEDVYAYPTLVCGNFLVGLTPPDSCNLDDAAGNYDDYHNVMTECQEEVLPSSSYERVLGGKMNDDDGWYLPFLYMDGYIDVYGPNSVAKAVREVMRGKVDRVVCDNLHWHIDLCEADGSNKCYENFTGSYVNISDNVYADIDNQETAFFFGFSEKVAAIIQETTDPNVNAYAAISVPLGETNHLLQFTDALVVNKACWDSADDDRRDAIKAFIDYFLDTDLRYNIALGKDLDPPQNRYLLQASETIYNMPDVDDDPVYQGLYRALQNAVAAPSLTTRQQKRMQKVLSRKCIR